MISGILHHPLWCCFLSIIQDHSLSTYMIKFNGEEIWKMRAILTTPCIAVVTIQEFLSHSPFCTRGLRWQRKALTLCLRNMLKCTRETRELLSFEEDDFQKKSREEAPVWGCFFKLFAFFVLFLPLLWCLSYSNNLLTCVSSQ